MGKKIADLGILFGSVALATYIAVWQKDAWKWPLFAVLTAFALLALNDFMSRLFSSKKKKRQETYERDSAVCELILLDENDKPVKSWDMSGKVSMVIGRDNPDEPVDVDLEECEYSALIDYLHAVLNFCRDAWYIEDLNSKNGIRIQKVDDGLCYKMAANRPCRLMPGDIIYIAKTKLLIT